MARMCHFVRRGENRVEMRSRFWIGHPSQKDGVKEKGLVNRLINKPMIKRLLLPKGIGSAMVMHCTQEYNNLTKILPELFDKYGDQL